MSIYLYVNICIYLLDGRVYIADGRRIRMIDQRGIISTIVGESKVILRLLSSAATLGIGSLFVHPFVISYSQCQFCISFFLSKETYLFFEVLN